MRRSVGFRQPGLRGSLTPGPTLSSLRPCATYSVITNQEAIRRNFRFDLDLTRNVAPLPGVFPGTMAPMVRNGAGGRELAMARWGMPSLQKALLDKAGERARKLKANNQRVYVPALLRTEPHSGTTNIRNRGTQDGKKLTRPLRLR
jgi:hypothetical protein